MERKRRVPFVKTVRRARLQSRLLVMCLLISLVPVVFVGLYAYNIYTNSINRQLGDSAEQAIKLLNTTLGSELDKFISYINSISVNETVQNTLSKPVRERNPSDGSVTLAIKGAIQQNPVQSRFLKNIRVIDIDRNVLYDLGYDDISRVQFNRLLDVTDGTSPKDSLQYIRTYRGVDTLVLGRKIHEFARSDHPIGYILVYFDESLLSDTVFGNITFGADSNILLLDGNGDVLSSKDRGLLGTSMGGEGNLLEEIKAAEAQGKTTLNTVYDGGRYLVIFDRNPELDTYFVATIPHEYIAGETRQITGNLALVAGIAIVICLLLTALIYLSIMQPIRRIMDFCNHAMDDTVPPIGDYSPDELGFMARVVERFVQEIKGFAHKSAADERRKRELELAMLQYQINPHFLFNTLNTLKWVAVINEVPVLSEGISSLSQLLQSTLIKKEETIPLSEELENLGHYFSIQKIRYADCFEVAYEVEEQLMAYPVPRFILQPLAENAIIHGTRDGGRSIHIRIAAHVLKDKGVELIVQDDGQGFAMADVDLFRKERFSGIGVSNVHERIQLHYGSAYGVSIESEPDHGTTCRILLPMPGERGTDEC